MMRSAIDGPLGEEKDREYWGSQGRAHEDYDPDEYDSEEMQDADMAGASSLFDEKESMLYVSRLDNIDELEYMRDCLNKASPEMINALFGDFDTQDR